MNRLQVTSSFYRRTLWIGQLFSLLYLLKIKSPDSKISLGKNVKPYVTREALYLKHVGATPSILIFKIVARMLSGSLVPTNACRTHNNQK